MIGPAENEVKSYFVEQRTEGGGVEPQWLMSAHRFGKPCPVPTGNTLQKRLVEPNLFVGEVALLCA
jgi:hypothetical protein